MPSDQLPASSGAATDPPNEDPTQASSKGTAGLPATPPVRDRYPALPDLTLWGLVAYIVDDDDRVARLVRILYPCSVLAVFVALLVLTSDQSLWIRLGVPTVGVAFWSGFFAVRRRRKSRSEREGANG